MAKKKDKKRRDALKKKGGEIEAWHFSSKVVGRRNITAHRVDYFRFVVGGGVGCKPGVK